MKSNDIIHVKINTVKGSALEKAIDAYLENLRLLRKGRREIYKKKVEKQINKIERSGL